MTKEVPRAHDAKLPSGNRVDQLYDESYKHKLATIRLPTRMVGHVKNGGSIERQPMGPWIFTVTNFRRPFNGTEGVNLAPTTRPRILTHSADLTMTLGLLYPWHERSRYREERWKIVLEVESALAAFAMTLGLVQPPVVLPPDWSNMPFGWRPHFEPTLWRRN